MEKETGIIMSGNHPELVLGGRKTQTRRVLKSQPPGEYLEVGRYYPSLIDKNGEMYPGDEIFGAYTGDGEWGCKCPYGQVGDRLYLKETHYKYGKWVADDGVTKTGKLKWKFKVMTTEVCYLDNSPTDVFPDTKRYTVGWFKRNTLFMFRKDSRITLEITELWVELLRSISPADALAEGGYTVEEFIQLYLKINHLQEDADPWNWAIKYKLLGKVD